MPGGVSLAIELAAARVSLLPPTALRARLDHRLSVLRGGPRDLPARHRTLRAAIDWSYGLLSAEEQRVLTAATVFAGSFTVEAIEAVTADDGIDVLSTLESLLDKSLLVRQSADGDVRIGMLATIREYAEDCLADAEDAGFIHLRHLTLSVAMAESTEPRLVGPDQVQWMRLL